MTKSCMVERLQMLKAMEFVARHLNDEEIFCYDWLTDGVADGDIEEGDLSVKKSDLESMEWYLQDDQISDIMTTFLWCMKKAYKSGGLYCDNVSSASARY